MTAHTDACSRHDAAFDGYGIENGTDLIQATYYRLRPERSRRVTVTPDLVAATTRAFRSVFVQQATLPVVPEPVDAAIVDAASETVHETLGEGRVDLRTEFVPAFYRNVARLTCQYCPLFPDSGAGVSYDG